jgi:hypothetical protein
MLARRCLGSPRDHPQAHGVPHHTVAVQVAYSALPGSLCQTKHLYLSCLRAAASAAYGNHQDVTCACRTIFCRLEVRCIIVASK